MAFAIAMDAFSVALGIGTYKLRIRQIFYIGLTVGLFHMILPLVGIFAGHVISATFGQISAYVGGALLICIGLQMAIACLRSGKSSVPIPVGWGLLVFSLIISLDSFSAGLSLGMFGVRAAAAVVCFGVVATSLTWAGLVIGSKFQNLLGIYGELLGGSILIIYGLKLLLPL